MLIVSSEDDFRAQAAATGAAVRASDPAHLTQLHLPTDHAYSSARVALALIAWLEASAAAPR